MNCEARVKKYYQTIIWWPPYSHSEDPEDRRGIKVQNWRTSTTSRVKVTTLTHRLVNTLTLATTQMFSLQANGYFNFISFHHSDS